MRRWSRILKELKIALVMIEEWWKEKKAERILRNKRTPENEQEKELQDTLNEILAENLEAQEYWINCTEDEWA